MSWVTWVAVMIVVGIVLFGLATVAIWYSLARPAQPGTLDHQDFDGAYDELIGEGEAVDRDRESAWQDFNAWQVRNEQQRRAWDEGTIE